MNFGILTLCIALLWPIIFFFLFLFLDRKQTWYQIEMKKYLWRKIMHFLLIIILFVIVTALMFVVIHAVNILAFEFLDIDSYFPSDELLKLYVGWFIYLSIQIFLAWIFGYIMYILYKRINAGEWVLWKVMKIIILLAMMIWLPALLLVFLFVWALSWIWCGGSGCPPRDEPWLLHILFWLMPIICIFLWFRIFRVLFPKKDENITPSRTVIPLLKKPKGIIGKICILVLWIIPIAILDFCLVLWFTFVLEMVTYISNDTYQRFLVGVYIILFTVWFWWIFFYQNNRKDISGSDEDLLGKNQNL